MATVRGKIVEIDVIADLLDRVVINADEPTARPPDGGIEEQGPALFAGNSRLHHARRQC
jgi:hypothetical protein